MWCQYPLRFRAKLRYRDLNAAALVTCKWFSANASSVTGTIPVGGKGVAVSQIATVERIFTEEDIIHFGTLVSDHNPLHRKWPNDELPPELQNHPLRDSRPIVHGMLASSLFSCIFGTLVPGAVYLKQSLDFKSPIFAEELVVGRIEVLRVRRFKPGIVVSCDTKVIRDNQDCIVGKADVWLPGGTKAS